MNPKRNDEVEGKRVKPWKYDAINVIIWSMNPMWNKA